VNALTVVPAAGAAAASSSAACRRFLELQFELVEQLAATLGGLPVLLALELGDHELVMGDQCLGTRGARFRLLASLPFGGQRCRQRGNVTGEVLGLDRHGPIVPWRKGSAATQLKGESISRTLMRSATNS